MSDKKIVYVLTTTADGRKTFWNRAGLGRTNRDGSINLTLFMLPDVKLQVRDYQPTDQEDDIPF